MTVSFKRKRGREYLVKELVKPFLKYIWAIWSRLTLRIYILKIYGTLTTTFNRADKLRLRRRRERLLAQPSE